MINHAPPTAPIDVVIFLGPRFPLLSLAICTETLRVANRELGSNRFTRRLLTAAGKTILSSSGIPITPDASIADIQRSDVVIVLTSYMPEEAATPAVLSWLRRQERMGALMACADTGAFLLARAGLLTAQQAAVHHEALPAYRALFEDAELIDRNAALEGRLASSAGGMATMDMMAGILARYDETGLAERVLGVLKYQPPDEPPSRDRLRAAAMERVDPRVARMVDLMLSSLEDPLPIAALCDACHVEASTARRLFQRQFGTSPARYHAGLRLDHAASLLANSAMPVGRVAGLSGYSDTAAFSRAFKARFGHAPTAHRGQARRAS